MFNDGSFLVVQTPKSQRTRISLTADVVARYMALHLSLHVFGKPDSPPVRLPTLVWLRLKPQNDQSWIHGTLLYFLKQIFKLTTKKADSWKMLSMVIES